MHGGRGACMSGGMFGGRACMAVGVCIAGGMHGGRHVWQGGHAWQGVGYAWQGGCVAGGVPGRGHAWWKQIAHVGWDGGVQLRYRLRIEVQRQIKPN